MTPEKMPIAIDFDGTIVDCQPRQVALVRHLLAKQDIELDGDRFWAYKRKGLSTRCALEAIRTDPNLAVSIAASWAALIEEKAWLALDRLFPESLKALGLAREEGHQLILLTARRSREGLYQTLDRLSLSDYFDEICIVTPQIATEAKAEILRNLQCGWMIGDTESDFRAAKLARVRFIAVSKGQRSCAFLEDAGVEAAEADLLAAMRHVLSPGSDSRATINDFLPPSRPETGSL